MPGGVILRYKFNSQNMATTIIKTFIAAAIIGILPGTVAMQAQEAPDSTGALALDEIVVKAPKVIRRADMDVYHPSRSAVESAANGVQLLGNLMIPALYVSDALGSVQAAGQPVQLRINGNVATVEQVRALRPETVKRVEWIDNPGLRYGGANYVLNFIVANPTLGGSLMAEARPALNQAWGTYAADVKLNSGHSQWEAGADFKLTDAISSHRDYVETFTRPDGTSLTRRETPLGGSVDNSMLNVRAAYNYIKPDTTVFVATLRLDRNLSDRTAYRGMLCMSDGSADVELDDVNGSRGTTPGLSLYWQQELGHKGTLAVNFNSSFYFGRGYSHYVERAAAETLNDISTNIRDKNRAYALEADYIKRWDDGARFTAGASLCANRNSSEYISQGGALFHQRQERVYVFAEYFRRMGKWTATVGAGLQYTSFRFRESGRGNNSWNPRPQATVTYSVNSNHNLRLSFTSWQTAPSLAETNVVPQQLDGFQWRVGNQDLKTSNSYMLTLRYGFNIPNVAGSFGIRAYSSPNAITPLTAWDGGRLVTTWENSRGLQNLSFFLAPQVEIIPDWLMASGYVQFRTERMRGTGYSHSNSAWSGNMAVQLVHWGFALSGQYVREQHDLWGEKISWGEELNIIDLSYSLKSWQFSAGVIMPFGRYDRGSKSLNRWNRNEQHMRLDMRMPYVAVSYNIRWGHQKHSAGKLVDADATADRSTPSAR